MNKDGKALWAKIAAKPLSPEQVKRFEEQYAKARKMAEDMHESFKVSNDVLQQRVNI